MKGSTHAMIGANAVWIPVAFGIGVQPWFVLIGAFAALLPDLDASESKIKHLSIGGYIGKAKVSIKPFVPVATIISAVFGHRGFLHSLAAFVIFTVASSFVVQFTSVTVWYLCIFGYFSHLLMDGLTHSGIELFWPFKRRIGLLLKPLRVKTGGLIDSLLLFIGSVGVVVFLYTSLQNFSFYGFF